jgi:hypothetical protein
VEIQLPLLEGRKTILNIKKVLPLLHLGNPGGDKGYLKPLRMIFLVL